MEERSIRLADGGVVSASSHGAGASCVALGHGAGGTRRTPFLLRLADEIGAAGRRALLFNFPYSESRKKLPDPKPRLEATIAAVAQFARSELGAERLVLGGKSMGGRIASQAVAQGLAADGLVFLGYPLHPPGKPDTLRDAHLPAIVAPMLFVQGTRDAFARWDLLEATLAKLGGRATLCRIEDGDHSFAVRKKLTGRTAADVEASIARAVLDWLAGQGL
jgi:predicted alpha/beta-hydrolase family hydrolase